MKKQYIFIILIFIIFYISFFIISFTYKEYQINADIEYIKNLTKEVEIKIDYSKKIIEYKTSKAYKNKILKEQQSFKNIWEDVIYLSTEEKFNKYTEKIEKIEKESTININRQDIISEKLKDLSIYEKWMYFLFKKDPDKE